MRAIVATALLTLIAGAGSFAQSSPAGDWRVQFATPLGQHVVTMTINVDGARLSGHVTDEYGEYPMSGRLADRRVTARWSVFDDGKMLEITMNGTLDGNVINGTAQLGEAGEGPLIARRIGDAGNHH
jgi:hypothetical protein